MINNLKDELKLIVKVNALQGPTFNVCEDLRGESRTFLMPVHRANRTKIEIVLDNPNEKNRM